MDAKPHEPRDDGPYPLDHDMAELSLLLPRAQAIGLIEAAKRRGMTVAQLLRRLVTGLLAEPAG